MKAQISRDNDVLAFNNVANCRQCNPFVGSIFSMKSERRAVKLNHKATQ